MWYLEKKKLLIIDFPTISADTNVMSIRTPFVGIFQAAVGRYQLNYYDAKRLCEINGGALATYNQLYASWQAGLGTCSYVDF